MLGIFRRRRLPHWDVPDATYFVTTCLAGSIPAKGLSEIRDYRLALDKRSKPTTMSEVEWEITKQKLVFAKWDEWLDGKPNIRHFDVPAVAAAVRRSIYHFAQSRYQLLAYVVMPSHVHWVFHPIDTWCKEIECNTAEKRTPREIIMHSFKSYTAHECNSVLGLIGEFWQDESYDHWIREGELLRIIEYVEQNPVKAGLVIRPEEYLYSSAYDRKLWNITAGEPLIPPTEDHQ